MPTIITNRLGLPEAIVNAVKNDTYSGSGTSPSWKKANASVVGLLRPPQIAYLARGATIEEDVADRIWAMLGSSVHTVLERAYAKATTDAKVELRLFTECNGWVVSGQFDVLENGVLSDYKLTSVYGSGGKIEWERQLNLLNLLCVRNGLKVEKLQSVLIFRDWRPREAANKPTYPQSQIEVVPVRIWPIEEAEAFLLERVKMHQQEVPPPCTDEDRWAAPEKWALMQKGRKSAIKLYDKKPDMELQEKQYWEHRPATYRRCESYCSVAHLCPQWDNGRERDDPGAE